MPPCQGSLFLQLHPSALTDSLLHLDPVGVTSSPGRSCRVTSGRHPHHSFCVWLPRFHLSGDQGAGVARAVVSAPASRRGSASRPAPAAFGSRAAPSRAVLFFLELLSRDSGERGHSTHLLSQPSPSGNGNHSTAFFLKERNSLLTSFYFIFF